MALTLWAAAGFVLALGGLTPWIAVTAMLAALTVTLRAWTDAATAFVTAWILASTMVFVALCLSPALPWHYAFTTAGVAFAVTLACGYGVRSPQPAGRDSDALAGGDWAALVAAPAVWLVSVALGHLIPGGAGWSWAAWVDSSLDVLETRRIVEYGGFSTILPPNPRPFEHAAAASGLGSTHPVDSSASTVAAELTVHALAWVALTAVSLFALSLVTLRLASALGVSRALSRGSAVVVGLLLLTGTGAGVTFVRGQINVHVVLLFLAATVIVHLSRTLSEPLRFAVHVLAMTALMLTWTPFAAVPGIAMLLTLVRILRSGAARSETARLAMLAASLYFLWALYIFAWRDLMKSLLPTSTRNQRRIEEVVAMANPAFLPLVLALVLIVVLGVLLARSTQQMRETLLASSGGITLGIVMVAAAGGLEVNPTAYYPARFLHLAGWFLLPVAVAVILAALRVPRALPRVAAASAAVAVALLAMLGPVDARVNRYAFAPVDIITGRWYGSHEVLAGRIMSWASDTEAIVAWRLDGRFGHAVNWMLALTEPVDHRAPIWSPFRVALRVYDDDYPVERACSVMEASERPVVFVTHDAGLHAELSAACPDGNWSVRLEGVSD